MEIKLVSHTRCHSTRTLLKVASPYCSSPESHSTVYRNLLLEKYPLHIPIRGSYYQIRYALCISTAPIRWKIKRVYHYQYIQRSFSIKYNTLLFGVSSAPFYIAMYYGPLASKPKACHCLSGWHPGNRNFLFCYHITLHSSNNLSSTELLFEWQLRSHLDNIFPTVDIKVVAQ